MMELPDRLAACERCVSIEQPLKAPCRLPGAPPLVANEAFDTAGCLDAEAGYGLAAFGGAAC